MIVENISSNSVERLELVYEIKYRPFLFINTSNVKREWSWKKFRFVYSMTVQKENPKVFLEIVENKTQDKTKKQTFSYMNLKGDLFKKEFYIDPNDKSYDVIKELQDWMGKINLQE